MSLCAIAALLGVAATAQASPPIDFMSIVRNADGKAVANLPAKFTVDIVADAHGEDILYSESHQTVTAQDGSARIMIGEGTPLSGDFDKIDWNGQRYVNVKVTGEGSLDYHTQGIISIMNVPYAMQAQSAETLMVATPRGGSRTLKINNSGELYWEMESNGEPMYDLEKAPEKLYFIGNFNSWNVSEALPMTKESQYVFSIEKELTTGEIFKFVSVQYWGELDWSGESSEIGTINGMKELGNTPDFEGPTGMYKITVDFYSYTLTITAL